MTASANPKTPMMQLPIRKGTLFLDVERFCQQSSRLNLSHLVEDITVTEHLRHRSDLRVKVFTVQIRFFPWKECQEAHYVTSSAIVNAIIRLAAILKRDVALEYRRLESYLIGQVASIGKGKVVRESRAVEEDPERSSEKEDRETSEIGDGDADEEKRKNQGQEQTTYEEEEGDDADEEEEEADHTPNEDGAEVGAEGGSQSEEDQMDLDGRFRKKKWRLPSPCLYLLFLGR